MKKVNMKKMVLRVGVAALLLLVLLGLGEAKTNLDCSFKAYDRMGGTWEPAPVGTPGRSIDGNVWVKEVVWKDTEWCEPLAYTLMPFLPLLILSLITYKMREEVFRAWWNFARWWVPIVFIGTIFCISMPSGGGFINFDALIYIFILGPLYCILILGSLWRIIRTRLQLKHTGKSK